MASAIWGSSREPLYNSFDGVLFLPWLISFSLGEKNTPNEYGVRNPHANRKCNQVNLFERHRLLCFFNNFLKARIAAKRVPPRVQFEIAVSHTTTNQVLRCDR